MMAKGNFDGRVGRMVDVLVDERLKDEWVTSGISFGGDFLQR